MWNIKKCNILSCHLACIHVPVVVLLLSVTKPKPVRAVTKAGQKTQWTNFIRNQRKYIELVSKGRNVYGVRWSVLANFPLIWWPSSTSVFIWNLLYHRKTYPKRVHGTFFTWFLHMTSVLILFVHPQNIQGTTDHWGEWVQISWTGKNSYDIVEWNTVVYSYIVGKVYIRAKWTIRPELILVSVA